MIPKALCDKYKFAEEGRVNDKILNTGKQVGGALMLLHLGGVEGTGQCLPLYHRLTPASFTWG